MAKSLPLCLCGCMRIVKDRHARYASSRCQQEHKYRQFIRLWIDGRVSGNHKEWETPSRYIRRYIFERDKYQCVHCGWGMKNPHTDTWPLVLDHIDGNSSNTVESNLRTLCPNCDSLTSTYRGANRGNGRLSRRKNYYLVKAAMVGLS